MAYKVPSRWKIGTSGTRRDGSSAQARLHATSKRSAGDCQETGNCLRLRELTLDVQAHTKCREARPWYSRFGTDDLARPQEIEAERTETRAALEQDPVARRKWLREEWPAIKRRAAKERALIFFEDESCVRLTPTVGRTWAPVGKTPIIRVTGKRASICVMSAINSAGRLFFSIPNRTINAEIYITFLKGLLAEYPHRRVFVVADKAGPHIAAATRSFAKGQSRLVLFDLPSYSPDFNPDEEVWSHLKHHELKGHNARDKKGLRQRTVRALRRMKQRPPLVRSFFYRTGVT